MLELYVSSVRRVRPVVTVVVLCPCVRYIVVRPLSVRPVVSRHRRQRPLSVRPSRRRGPSSVRPLSALCPVRPVVLVRPLSVRPGVRPIITHMTSRSIRWIGIKELLLIWFGK